MMHWRWFPITINMMFILTKKWMLILLFNSKTLESPKFSLIRSRVMHFLLSFSAAWIYSYLWFAFLLFPLPNTYLLMGFFLTLTIFSISFQNILGVKIIWRAYRLNRTLVWYVILCWSSASFHYAGRHLDVMLLILFSNSWIQKKI